MLAFSLAALATCNPPLPLATLPGCSKYKAPDSHLCKGSRLLLSTSCEKLLDRDFLENLVCNTVGVAQLGDRTAGLYGPRTTTNCVRNVGGLCQQPAQIAGALLALASQNITSYIELGIANGWTTVLISSYLRRFAPSHAMRGYAIDITHEWLSPPIRTLMKFKLTFSQSSGVHVHICLSASTSTCAS